MKNKRLSILVLLAGVLAVQTAGADDNPVVLAKPKPKAHKVRQLNLKSHIALIYDEQGQHPLYKKHSDTVVPIASITKLMTAMVMLDAQLPMDQEVSVEDDDLNRIRRAKSRLRVGMTLTRSEMLKLALMASENRAALALARSYPGGPQAMVSAMNAKAHVLGMENTRFFDPTGLDSDNVSTAQDLVKMVAAARRYPLIHQYTTSSSHSVEGLQGRTMRFSNTNPLVRNASWDIGVSKTGYISEAGLCLVMEATIKQRPVIIVLLDSWGKHTRVGDANRIRSWMESLNAADSGGAGSSIE
jgi:D-alanyl-D-alanine endopeptidase (penicillin-binding protein 7)